MGCTKLRVGCDGNLFGCLYRSDLGKNFKEALTVYLQQRSAQYPASYDMRTENGTVRTFLVYWLSHAPEQMYYELLEFDGRTLKISNVAAEKVSAA